MNSRILMWGGRERGGLHTLAQPPQPLPPHTNANLTTEVYQAAQGAWHSLSFARYQLSFRMLSGREFIPDHTREKGHRYEGEEVNVWYDFQP